MPSNTSRPKVGIIEQLLDDLTKQAEARTEPGSIGGASAHPTAKVEDNTQAVSTGQRFAENASDIKAEPNTGAIVDSTSELPVGQMQDAAQVNIGMTSKATGEDPANETGSTKAKKEDGSIGGSSEHPARTDNDSLDGNKYASQYDYFKALCKRAEELGSQAAAAIAVAVEKAAAEGTSSCDIGTDKMEAADAPKKQPSEAPTDATEAKMPEEGQKEKMAEAVGAELADIFAKASLPVEDAVTLKQAAEDYLEDLIKTAEYRAQLTADYYDAHFRELRKIAEEGYEEKEDDDDDDDSEKSESSESSDSSGGAPGMPSAPPTDGAAAGGDASSLEALISSLSEEELAQLLGGGESMGAPAAVDGMGGGMGGGDVSADLGAMPPAAGGMGGAPAAGGEDAAALEAALAELGMSPEELEMALAAKQASAKRAKQASAKQSADAKQAAFNQKKASMKKMIQELVSRSRG